ncbi:hypothetical protein DOTSEDRAFT_26854 [Dothistroma septosporum NZE10]|uniref:Uncharacterized protein n=1 Tax=Dothistroma septosporum (strain NZE10 / CBS 128990) TaxID=675120 RepID=N1PGK0_DOTSN|nr:hypothetical protein DOTSEDRAFT_26854 [Dothistroma septosporum NZE10]
MCNTNVAIATWSQGGLDAQWATTYWPSTREKVTDVIAFSPDYKGTTSSSLLTDLGILLPQSYYQQAYYSSFIRALRANGGDSAYVPTTTVYSTFFDLVVQPQSGDSASAFFPDARGVMGILYNPIGDALLVDALTHDGPGQMNRISEGFCGNYLTEGLNLADLQLTENTLVVAALSLLLGGESTTQESPVRGYAYASLF